jgi:FKBP-type peptidyl-prolyl cis-trans isomerase FkpA
MSQYLGALRVRSAATIASIAVAMLAMAACGSVVPVSSDITPPPPSCFTPRAASAVDSFSTQVALQAGAQGLQYGDIRVGCGNAASATSNANVLFTVWLTNGTQVVTTRGSSQPASALQLGNPSTLAFWRVGVPGMRVGGTRRLVVPPALGFGAAGSSSANVPANATLVVDVELVSIS